MSEYTHIRVRKPVFEALHTLQLPRESLSDLIYRLVLFYRQVKLDVTLAEQPGSKKTKEGG